MHSSCRGTEALVGRLLEGRGVVWLLMAAAALVGLSFGACTQDDAFITFRYAEHLVQGHGLVFNIGERVEGYTNLSWTLLMAACMAIGAEPVVASTLLGLSCLCGVVWATWRLGGGGTTGPLLIVAPLLVALDAQLALESVEGLETALYVLLCTLGTTSAIRGERWGGAGWFSLACLTRPEGVLMWAVVHLGLGLRDLGQGALWQRVRATVRSAVPIVLCLMLLTAWRVSYYGDPLPNTFYAKTGGVAVARGLQYIWTHVLSHPVLWVLVAARLSAGALSPRTIPLVVAAGSYLLYVIVIGGDFKPTGRFVLPVLPMLAVLAQETVGGLVTRGSAWLRGVPLVVLLGIAGTAVHQVGTMSRHAAERHANLESRKLVGDWIAYIIWLTT